MTFAQIAAFTILIVMVGLFVWDRIRYDVVAVMALVAAIVCGIVPTKEAFKGFSDDIVIIVGSALVVSAAVGRSGAIEYLMRPIAPRLQTSTSQVAVLTSLVTVLAAFMKNIGAVAIFMPVALQIARRTGKPASRLLMPISFGSLLGGLATLIGTSPNIIVSRVRQDIMGEPYSMFDFTPVGATLALVGVIFLSFGWRLLPGKRGVAEAPAVEDYTVEACLPPESPFVGRTVGELEAQGEGDVTVTAIIREKVRRYVPQEHWVLQADDLLVLECDTRALERIITSVKLRLLGNVKPAGEDAREGDIGVSEAVVTRGSRMIGESAETLRLRDRHGVNLLALSRGGQPVSQRLRRVRFQAGDAVVLQGRTETMMETLGELGCLPLAELSLRLKARRDMFLPLLILAAAMALVAAGLAAVTVAFFTAAVLMIVLGQISLRDAYEAIEWPLLIMLGALIPVSEALQSTGGTDLIAGGLSVVAAALPPAGAVALILVAAMGVTPFLNNAATVLVMAPIGAGMAQQLGLRPDAFLMAVAVGAACDFLTPIGHQCNTLVMGPGGYRFGDYWRLGLPLSILVVVLGTLLITIFWPMRGA